MARMRISLIIQEFEQQEQGQEQEHQQGEQEQGEERKGGLGLYLLLEV